MKLRMHYGMMFCLVAFILLAGQMGGQQNVAADDDIYIALSAPITGDYAEYGNNFKRSVEMGIDLINQKGGVLGKKLKVIIGDSKGDPKESSTLAQKFTSDKKIVAEIGDFTSTCCLAAQPIYDEVGMVQLSPTSSHPDFAKGSKYSFGIIGTQAGEGPFMAMMTNELGFKKVAILHINNDWGIVTDKYYSEALATDGIEVVAREFYFDGERDFTAVLAKLKNSNPDMLFIASMYNDGALINKQKQKLGWDVPVLGPGSLYSPKLIELGGDAVEGLYTTVVFHPKNPKPEVQTFVSEFEKRYEVTPNMFAAVAFDAINLMADAIERAGSTDSVALRDAIAATKEFPGVTGKIAFTEVGDVMKEYTRVQIRNGEFVVYAP
ncbi:MAG: ABC transporter substrate-binding protein [bacterium]|nr:ABC transporter substrate-binding protein [bacterium]